MQTPPTAEQVRTLAPDAAAARAAEALANPRHWSATGRSPSAAWGLCQGSGSAPYQVAVDLGGPAYKCSCPSHKIPCKHALGLLFVLAGGGIAAAEPPDWASAWFEARTTRAAAAATRANSAAEPDPAARAKRVELREKKVAAGIDELDRWLGDLIRRGLDGARSDGYRFWDAMGARLVDAQAASLGRMVRSLGSAANAGDAWPHLLLEGTARLHLVCEAYRRLGELPEGLRSDVRSLVGWTTREEDLDPGQGIEDRWLVIGRQVDDSGSIMTARTWLLGEASGRLALHLAFGVGAAPPTVLALPGQAFRATLSFYPSATPLRAAVRPVLVPDGEVNHLPAGSSIPDILAMHADRLAANPFIDAWPVIVDGVVPVLRDEDLLVRHADGTALPAAPASVGTRLLAVSGGHPISLIADWDGTVLRAISAFADGRLVDLDAGPSPPSVNCGAAPWPQLVSAALIGTERSGDLALATDDTTELVAAGPVRDTEHRLLATAGIVALRRRAGGRPRTDAADLPVPAPHDPRPALAGSPARLLQAVLSEHRRVLGEYLGLVRASGRRLPEEWLPELMGAVGQDLRDTVADLGGPRATWLAGVVPELRDSATPEVSASAEEAWEAASGAEQRELAVRTIRAREPDKGRELVETRLGQLDGEERVAALEAMEVGLSPADEAVLARSLGDRRADVRRAAADLLARLEDSAFARSVVERARPLLANRGRLRPGLGATLPQVDQALDVSGFAGKPAAGVGERAWLLRQLIAHVPPIRWTDWLGAGADALIERALRAEEARPILEGWIDATGRFSDAGWAAALLAEPKVVQVATGIDLIRVLDGLTLDAAADVVAEAAQHLDQTNLARLADRCASPWPRPLVDAVFATLAKSISTVAPEYGWYTLIRDAATTAPPDRAAELEALASVGGSVRPSLVAAVETIRFREQMHAAFAGLQPAA